MKAMISAMLMVASLGIEASAANMDVVECQTAKNKFGGSTDLTVSPKGGDNFELKGQANGGIAQFVREIGPVEVKATFEGDLVKYVNASQGLELDIITTNIGGKLHQSATFNEGGSFPAETMTCKVISL